MISSFTYPDERGARRRSGATGCVGGAAAKFTWEYDTPVGSAAKRVSAERRTQQGWLRAGRRTSRGHRPLGLIGRRVEPLRRRCIAAVVHCTGYRLDYQALVDLPGLYGDRGYPVQERGAATHHPGLFFLGLPWMVKWQSAVLCGIAEDAKHVVACIAARILPEPVPTQLLLAAWRDIAR